MLTPLQQQVISIGLLGLGVYFFVQLARGLAGYLRFRQVWPTAVLTWPAPKPAQLPWLLAMGAMGAITAAVNAWLHRPPHHVVGLALMAVYFLGLVPLARRIRLGALPRRRLGAPRLPALEGRRPHRVRRGRRRSCCCSSRAAAARRSSCRSRPRTTARVRKLIEEQARAGVLRLDPAILGL